MLEISHHINGINQHSVQTIKMYKTYNAEIKIYCGYEIHRSNMYVNRGPKVFTDKDMFRDKDI